MTWDLQYGAKIEWFLELAESGEYVKALEEKPVIYQDLILDYEAFIILNNSRLIGMTEGSIPLSEIYAYMKIFEIFDYNQRKLFLKRIRFLDKVYLDFIHESNTKKVKDKK